jgi:hypothetical protein
MEWFLGKWCRVIQSSVSLKASARRAALLNAASGTAASPAKARFTCKAGTAGRFKPAWGRSVFALETPDLAKRYGVLKVFLTHCVGGNHGIGSRLRGVLDVGCFAFGARISMLRAIAQLKDFEPECGQAKS